MINGMQTKTRQPICLARVRKSQANPLIESVQASPKHCESPADPESVASVRTTALKTREPLHQVLSQKYQLLSQKASKGSNQKLNVSKNSQNLIACKNTEKSTGLKVIKKKSVDYTTPRVQKATLLQNDTTSCAKIHFSQMKPDSHCKMEEKSAFEAKIEEREKIEEQSNLKNYKYLENKQKVLEIQQSLSDQASKVVAQDEKIKKTGQKLTPEVMLLRQDREERDRVWLLMQNDFKTCRAQLEFQKAERASLIKANEILLQEKERLQEKLYKEEGWKEKLVLRVQYLQKELDSLSKQCQLPPPRMSVDEQWVERAKNNRNQLELERIKNANLIRQIESVKFNQQIQIQREKEKTEKQLQQIKEKYQKKCQEIKDKDKILRSFIG